MTGVGEQSNVMDYQPHKLRKKERALRIISFSDNFQDGFYSYLEDNWKVFERFEEIAFELIHQRRPHIGSKMIIERIRWMETVEENNTGFKINNNWAPDFSRLFHSLYPKHKGFFREKEREVI